MKTEFSLEYEPQSYREEYLLDMQKIIYQIVFGLQTIHNQGYVLRDLKPENILLNSEMDPKITDLGFATAIGTYDPAICGTLSYIAP